MNTKEELQKFSKSKGMKWPVECHFYNWEYMIEFAELYADKVKNLNLHGVMHCLLQEIEKLDTNDEHKDWYTATLQHRLTEAKKQDGNLAVAILNALDDYLK